MLVAISFNKAVQLVYYICLYILYLFHSSEDYETLFLMMALKFNLILALINKSTVNSVLFVIGCYVLRNN